MIIYERISLPSPLPAYIYQGAFLEAPLLYCAFSSPSLYAVIMIESRA